MPQEEYRTCKKCGVVAQSNTFTMTNKKTGLRSLYCGPCRLENRRQYRKSCWDKNPEKMKEQSRRYNAQQRSIPGNIKKLNDHCKEWYRKNRERARRANDEWKKRNKERLIEIQAEFRRSRPPEYFLSMGRKSYGKNREAICARRAKYRQEGRYKHNGAIRKARIMRADGWSTPELISQKFSYYGYRCRYCGCDIKVSPKRSIDHAIPLSRGGSAWTSNLLPCCRKCNTVKNKRTFFEYMRILQNGKNPTSAAL